MSRARLGLLIGGPWGGGTGDQRNLSEPAGWRGLCETRGTDRSGSQGKDQSPEVLEVGQMAGAQGWDLGGGQHPYVIPPKGMDSCWTRSMERVLGQSRNSWRGQLGGCREMLDSFPLHCSLPEIYF